MERIELARLLGAKGGAADGATGAVVVEERDPIGFMAEFARAAAGNGPVFLADPGWGENERTVLAEIVGQAGGPSPDDLSGRKETAERGWLMIPTGGTGGRIKFARHDQETLAAAVRGFCVHFGVGKVNCIGVLPLHHVSGLMAWTRAALTSGEYVPWDWKRLEAGDRPARKEGSWFLSLVPTQLQRLLGSPEAVEWLRDFDAVFVGGGPLWPELAEAAARARLPLSIGYGMTETAAMVTGLRPGEFLSGDRSCGASLPHARLDLTEAGLVRISGHSVFRGYFPHWTAAPELTTEDMGAFDESGHLRILGRRDAVIITGGKKVDPAEVEAALRATGEFNDLAVVGVPDSEWGQAVVACYPMSQPTPDLGRMAVRLEALPAFKRPRRYQAIAPWPQNAQGKVNRSEVLRLATMGVT